MAIWVSREPSGPQLITHWLKINSKRRFYAKKITNKNMNISFVFSSVFLCKFHLKCAGSNSGFMNLIYFLLFLEYIKTVIYLVPGKRITKNDSFNQPSLYPVNCLKRCLKSSFYILYWNSDINMEN